MSPTLTQNARKNAHLLQNGRGRDNERGALKFPDLGTEGLCLVTGLAAQCDGLATLAGWVFVRKKQRYDLHRLAQALKRQVRRKQPTFSLLCPGPEGIPQAKCIDLKQMVWSARCRCLHAVIHLVNNQTKKNLDTAESNK